MPSSFCQRPLKEPVCPLSVLVYVSSIYIYKWRVNILKNLSEVSEDFRPPTLDLIRSHFDGGSNCSLAQGYSSSKLLLDWGWVPTDNSGLPFQNLSPFSTDIHSGRRNWNTANVAARGWGLKGEWKEPGKRLGMKEKWEERVRTNFKNWTLQGKHAYTGGGNCDQQVGRNQTSKIEGGQTEELRLRAGKNDVMNYLAGKTVCQHLGKYWKNILNRKLSSCEWEKRWLVLDKDHRGKEVPRSWNRTQHRVGGGSSLGRKLQQS